VSHPILLIEDDPDIRLLAEMSLRMSGLEVVACAEGAAGLKALEDARFSLVILDVMMPDMSGFEVMNRITNRYGEQSPPIALFTAKPRDSIEQELAGRKDVHILPKPFDPATLAKIVLSLIRDAA
jgi:two-component system, OmpR family, response regulator